MDRDHQCRKIAHWMGHPTRVPSYYANWGALMEVLHRIEADSHAFLISSQQCIIHRGNPDSWVAHERADTTIDATFNAVSVYVNQFKIKGFPGYTERIEA